MSEIHLKDAVALSKSIDSQSIDLIITDIAYESLEKHRSKGTTTRLAHSKSSSNDWFPIFPNDRILGLMEQFYRIMKPNTHMYLFTDSETSLVLRSCAQEVGFHFWNDLIWVKTSKTSYPNNEKAPDHQFVTGHRIKSGMGYHYRKCKETVLMFGRGPKPGKRDRRKLNDLSVKDVLPFPSVSRGYPTEKPLGLYELLLKNSSEPGEVVYDPFAGSGTICEAAMNHGRSFIASDIHMPAVQSMINRIQNDLTDVVQDQDDETKYRIVELPF